MQMITLLFWERESKPAYLVKNPGNESKYRWQKLKMSTSLPLLTGNDPYNTDNEFDGSEPAVRMRGLWLVGTWHCTGSYQETGRVLMFLRQSFGDRKRRLCCCMTLTLALQSKFGRTESWSDRWTLTLAVQSQSGRTESWSDRWTLTLTLQSQSGRTESSTVWALELRCRCRCCCCDGCCCVSLFTGSNKALPSLFSKLRWSSFWLSQAESGGSFQRCGLELAFRTISNSLSGCSWSACMDVIDSACWTPAVLIPNDRSTAKVVSVLIPVSVLILVSWLVGRSVG